MKGKQGYTTINGLTMVVSEPYNWKRESLYAGPPQPPYIYTISLHISSCTSSERDWHICSYKDENKTLRINGLSFLVDDIDHATKLVESFVKGNNYEKNLEDTIYTTIK